MQQRFVFRHSEKGRVIRYTQQPTYSRRFWSCARVILLTVSEAGVNTVLKSRRCTWLLHSLREHRLDNMAISSAVAQVQGTGEVYFERGLGRRQRGLGRWQLAAGTRAWVWGGPS